MVGLSGASYLNFKDHVAPEPAVAKSTPTLPQNAQQQLYTNYKIYLSQLTDSQDPKVALVALAKASKTNDSVAAICHGLAHEIGREAYRRYQNFDAALHFEDQTCGSGYLHGVIETRFAASPNILATMQASCSVSDDRCLHGVGHGLMYYTANDLPKSLSYCSQYPSFARSYCAEGVFMENFSTDIQLHPSIYLHPNDPFFPCSSQVGVYKGGCYYYAPSYYLRLHPDQYAAGLVWCQSAEAGYVPSCTAGLGSRAMKYTINHPQAVAEICAAAPATQVNDCLDGAVSYYIVNQESLGSGRLFCQQVALPLQLSCQQSVNRRVGWFRD